jgi:hypothetical protein
MDYKLSAVELFFPALKEYSSSAVAVLLKAAITDELLSVLAAMAKTADKSWHYGLGNR